LQNRRISNFTGTAFQVARFMTLLAQRRLIGSTDMINVMTATSGGIGSYVREGLRHAQPPRSFSSVHSKVGIGDDDFNHDCAIVRIERGGDPTRTISYVSVALGSARGKARADLRKLAVGFHDCTVARHP
jgi:hypothetical protein